jgi:hypothetical protein
MDDRERSLTTAFYLRTFMLDLHSAEPLHSRRFAASVLRDYADARTLCALIDALDDDDEELRRTASEGVEAILNADATSENLSLCVVSEAMDRVRTIYAKIREPAILRIIVTAIASQHAGLAIATRDMLRTFSCPDLLTLACEHTPPLSTEARDALLSQCRRLQQSTVHTLIETVVGSEGEALAKTALDLLVELPGSLEAADCIHLLQLMASDNMIAANLGWSALDGLLLRPKAPSEVYTEARLWVRDHFEEWIRICSVADPVKQQVLAILRQKNRFTERPGQKELRICARLTQDSGPLANTAWDILSTTFHEEIGWRISSENDEADIFWAIQTVTELAVGQIPGNQNAARDLLLQNPSCLHTIIGLDLLAAVTRFENVDLTNVAWQRLKHLIDSEKIKPGNEVWASVITESDPRMIPAFLLLLGLKHHNGSAEASAWKIILRAKSASVSELLVQLLSHERQSVQELAFKALCSRRVRPDLLLKILVYACKNTQLDRLIEQYGQEACWDTLLIEFTRFASTTSFKYIPGELFPEELFRYLVLLDERKTLDLLFKGVASDDAAERNGMLDGLFCTCRSLLNPQSIQDIHGALLVIEVSAPDIQIPYSIKSWHNEFKGILNPEALCRLVLLSRYGAPAQIVNTLNSFLPVPSGDNRASNTLLFQRLAAWKKEEALIAAVQRVEDYLMGVRPAGFHPTPPEELLRGAETPTDTKPIRGPGFWSRFG